MKSRESLVRLKEFQVNEKRRQLQQLQMMMAEFDRMTKELESQIVLEEKKSGISDPSHFAYPTFAKAARQRADNLQVSIRELRAQEEALETLRMLSNINVGKRQMLQLVLVGQPELK